MSINLLSILCLFSFSKANSFFVLDSFLPFSIAHTSVVGQESTVASLLPLDIQHTVVVRVFIVVALLFVVLCGGFSLQILFYISLSQ